MADNYDRYDEGGNGGGFVIGLLTGAVLGAGLGMLLAPRAGSELRGQIGEQAKNLGNYAADQYRRAGETASGLAGRGRDIVERAREAVVRGAEEARSYASGTSTGASSGGNYAAGPSSGASSSDFGRS